MRGISLDAMQERLEQLRNANLRLGNLLNGECIFIHSPMFAPVNRILELSLERLNAVHKQNHLVVMLETDGGSVEIVEHLVSSMRRYYGKVSFIIVEKAMSAGTVLVLSGDEIYMNTHSFLGSIDPQFKLSDGRFLPGQGLIEALDHLRHTINSAQNKDDVLAERIMLHKSYVAAEEFEIRNAIKLSKTLIVDWLPKYKFKNWSKTSTREIPVTDQMKLQRAEEISEIFGDSQIWLSHYRGITMDKLTQPPIDLRINDYGNDRNLKKSINDYFFAALELFDLLEVKNCIHTHQKLWRC